MTTRRSHAAALHRQAAAVIAAARPVLDRAGPPAAGLPRQRDLAGRLRAAAATLTPGWLGAQLDAAPPETPLGASFPARFVRIGTAQPLDDARFPALVPLLGVGHLALDADAGDSRVAGLLRALLLRLLAAAPVGSLLVRAVDGAGSGVVFAPFAPLADAGVLPPPVTDVGGLRAVLAEAEQWTGRVANARRDDHSRTLLLVIASLPAQTDGADLARIEALAQQGPERGLHLAVAGWPPRPADGSPRPPLPRSTTVAVRESYALVGDPPGGFFSAPAPEPTATGLNAPVLLDADPPGELVRRVCDGLRAALSAEPRLRLTDLLPAEADELWSEESADGLSTPVGHDSDTSVTLQFNDLTPHWMVGGRSGAGVSAFLINVLYGLSARYAPAELTVYLLDFSGGGAFAEFVPSDRDRSWLPQALAVGVECDREYGVAVLRELDAELTRRSVTCKKAGVSRFAELREEHRLPRMLCVIDEFPALLDGRDALADEAVSLLESLARRGRSYGIHLLLASRRLRDVPALHGGRESMFGHIPVRVALPGGGDVLEPANDAAAGLPVGTAVVNTAGGLGGPRGATRGHERTVRFPDPDADRAALTALRHRVWSARSPEASPPRVFAGYAQQFLNDDPTYRAALAGRSTRPAALIGRTIDVPLSTATFPLDTSPGRHLAILGPSPIGADVLEAAARSVAAHHAPRTTRFVIASLVAAGDEPAAALAAELTQRQEVETVDVGGLLAALGGTEPGYLVVFGMDAAGPGRLPPDTLRSLLRDGPGRGLHLLSWWRGVRRFAEELDGDAREEVAGMVFLNVPGADVSLLLGAAVDWTPRPNRALLHDRHADRTTVIVPFVRPERAS
nr:FtsK/SpoIIIE domain-containing protein [Micromonospora pattaloongensis]